MKKKRKAVINESDAPVVSRMFREKAGRIDEIFFILFQEEGGKEFIADVIAAPHPSDGIKIPLNLADRIGEPIPVWTAEPKHVENLENICEVLRDMGYTCRIQKLYVMPSVKAGVSSLISGLQRVWDANREGLNDAGYAAFAKAMNGLRAINDNAGKDLTE